MKFNDNITLDIANAVRDVLEGKVKKEEAKYPHDMFHPETGEKEVAKDEAEHKALKDKGYTHEKPEVDEVAEPRAKGEKDFKAKHTIKKVGVKADLDGTVITKEAVTENKIWAKMDDRAKDQMRDKYQKLGAAHDKLQDRFDFEANDIDGDEDKADEIMDKMERINQAKQDMVQKYGRGVIKAKGFRQKKEAAEKTPNGPTEEETEKQKKYQAFFQKALKKFGVKSPAELEGDKKKEFFDYVDANYEADDEPKESVKVDEILGGIKKVAQKVKQKIKGTPKPGTKMKGDGSNDPAQKMMDEIDVLQAKMKDYQKKEKEAADDDKADYWLNAYNNAADKVYDLKQKLKKEVGADMYGGAK